MTFKAPPLQDALQLLCLYRSSLCRAKQHGQLHPARHVQDRLHRDPDQERRLPQAHLRRDGRLHLLGRGGKHDCRRQEVERRLRRQVDPAGDEVPQEGLPRIIQRLQKGRGQLSGLHHELQPGLLQLKCERYKLESERHSHFQLNHKQLLEEGEEERDGRYQLTGGHPRADQPLTIAFDIKQFFFLYICPFCLAKKSS